MPDYRDKLWDILFSTSLIPLAASVRLMRLHDRMVERLYARNFHAKHPSKSDKGDAA